MSRITEPELEQLVEELGPSLVLFARQWCSCPDDALQEALIELVKQNPAPRSPKAWLFRVVRNKAMNMARSERRRSHYESFATGRDLWFDADSTSPSDTEHVMDWIENLPDIQRQIVTSRIWGGLTFEQVADVVDRPTATVFRLFGEAIDTVRQQIRRVSEEASAADRSRGKRS